MTTEEKEEKEEVGKPNMGTEEEEGGRSEKVIRLVLRLFCTFGDFSRFPLLVKDRLALCFPFWTLQVVDCFL